MSDLDAEIVWLSRLVMERYAPQGILVERVDSRMGTIVHDRFILDELGDFLQNVAALAPLCGDERSIDRALGLVRTTRASRFRRGGLFETFAFPARRWRRLQGLGFAFPYWNLDPMLTKDNPLPAFALLALEQAGPRRPPGRPRRGAGGARPSTSRRRMATAARTRERAPSCASRSTTR